MSRDQEPRSVDSGQKPPSGTRSLSFYVVVLVAIQVVCLIGFTASVSINDFRATGNAATKRAAEDAQKAASLIAGAVDTAGKVLTSEAKLPGYAAVFDDPSRCTVTSGGTQVFTKGQFHVLRPDGTVACSSTRAAGGVGGRGYAGQPWLASIARSEEPIVYGPTIDPLTDRPSLIVAAAISEVPGSVVLSLDLSALGAGLKAELGDRVPPSEFLVTTKDRSSEIARSTAGDSPIAGTAFTAPIAEGTSTRFVDGEQRIHAEASVPELGWHVVAGISKSETFARTWGWVKERGLSAGMVLILIAAIGWLLHRRVARPIRALVSAVEEAIDATKPVQVPEEGPRELRRLGRRFNRMLRERAENQIGLVDLFPTERREGSRREIDRIKSAFLMAVSHELRTPLAVITGYAELLEEEMAHLSREEATEIAHNIGLGAARLEAILLDILDLERMSRGVFEAQRRATHLHDLVKSVVDVSDSRGDVRINVPKGLVVDIDPRLVERILDNLIRNAIKHTPAGTPMSIEARSRRGDLELIVEDAGPGIPDDLKPEVFEPFTQGKTPSHSPGTGIGLSLVAQFARLHDGQAWVDDRPGGGARFHVLLAGAHGSAKRATLEATA